MPDTTPDIKDLTGSEILSDVPDLLAIATTAAASFGGEKPTTALGWVTRLGFAEAGIIGATAAAFDRLHSGPVDVDTVSAILGLTPGELMDLVRLLAVKVISQAND